MAIERPFLSRLLSAVVKFRVKGRLEYLVQMSASSATVLLKCVCLLLLSVRKTYSVGKLQKGPPGAAQLNLVQALGEADPSNVKSQSEVAKVQFRSAPESRRGCHL